MIIAAESCDKFFSRLLQEKPRDHDPQSKALSGCFKAAQRFVFILLSHDCKWKVTFQAWHCKCFTVLEIIKTSQSQIVAVREALEGSKFWKSRRATWNPEMSYMLAVGGAIMSALIVIGNGACSPLDFKSRTLLPLAAFSACSSSCRLSQIWRENFIWDSAYIFWQYAALKDDPKLLTSLHPGQTQQAALLSSSTMLRNCKQTLNFQHAFLKAPIKSTDNLCIWDDYLLTWSFRTSSSSMFGHAVTPTIPFRAAFWPSNSISNAGDPHHGLGCTADKLIQIHLFLRIQTLFILLRVQVRST